MKLDYDKLEQAGNETYRTCTRPQLKYPEGEEVEWYGYKRHNFLFEGRKAFIVEPPNPAPEFPWSWCLQWAEAFVPRTPALKQLERETGRGAGRGRWGQERENRGCRGSLN